jgi:hypothetical protein
MTKTYAVIDTDTGQLVSVSTDPPGAPKSRILTRLAFMRRFTDIELATIYTAEEQSVVLEVWLDKFRLAEEISLDDPEIVGGVNALEQMGLLKEGRAKEILK